MGLITKTLAASIIAVPAAFVGFTRQSRFVPFVLEADPISKSSFYKKYNPETNPSTHDLCIRRVPLAQIKPELLSSDGKEDGALAEKFCAGVWSGLGYRFQRWYLARKHQNPSTAHQLWSPSALKNSKYDVGTQITDHFEVLSKTPEAIIVRCGDSPMKADVRPGDGLFEMGAVVKGEEGVVEFSLKSVFYQGLGKSETGKAPMPVHVEWLHRQYTKLWMETAERNCVR